MSVPATPAQSKFRILIMESDAATGEAVVGALGKFGMECRYAPDGRAGMIAFQTMKPHLAMVDIMMAEENGWIVCGKIRQTSTIPIIMTGNNVSQDDMLKSYKIGADECIPKPYDLRMLSARVLTQLRRVYRYDRRGEPAQTDAETTETKLPSGWASCDACGYMGPLQKFDTHDTQGKRIIACPHCKQRDHIVFSVS